MEDKYKKAFRYWQRYLGYSDDSADFFIGGRELSYRKTNNPKYVWEAIRHINGKKMSYYPKWVRDYLGTTAKQIAKCTPVAGGQSEVVAALGFSSLRQLREEDRDRIESAFYDMCYLIHCGKTIEQAAMEVEYTANNDGLKPKQRGYLGNSKLEKIYREFKKTISQSKIEDHIEGCEYFEEFKRHYEKAQKSGYEKDFSTYIDELSQRKLDKKYDDWFLSDYHLNSRTFF